jgi:hypothetical protein
MRMSLTLVLLNQNHICILTQIMHRPEWLGELLSSLFPSLS